MGVPHLGVHSRGCALLSHRDTHRAQSGAPLKLSLSWPQFLGRLTPAAVALEELVRRVNAACWVGSGRGAAGSCAGLSASPPEAAESGAGQGAAAAGRAAGGCM